MNIRSRSDMHCTHADIYIHNYSSNYLLIFVWLKLKSKSGCPSMHCLLMSGIYMNCHSKMDSQAHFVPRHCSLILFPPEHLKKSDISSGMSSSITSWSGGISI